VIAELLRYLRGRERADIVERLRAGAEEAGTTDVEVYADELAALRGMLARSRRGDVVAVTALGMRPEIFAWLDEAGAERLGPAPVRRLVAAVRRSRGSPPTGQRRAASSTHRTADGIASRRSSPIGRPQTSQTP
jgi:hypothetical protein